MLSFCVELKTACKYCGDPLPINALAETFRCEKCGKDNTIPEDTWKSLLEDNVKELGGYEEGEGQNSTVMTGEYNFALTFGKQKPRCGKCKTTIPEKNIYDYKTAGDYKCEKCGNEIHIRPADKLAESIVSDAMFIAGEDTTQFSTGQGNFEKPQASKPVIFTCPSCAGALKVDGSKRIIACSYCNSDIYLPDDLWFALHPAKTIERWYITMNPKKMQEKLQEWYYLSDVASDNYGNTYMASANNGKEDFIIWSFSPELKTRWVRKGLNLDYENTRIAVTNDDRMLICSPESKYIRIISAKDGSDIKKIEPGGKGCYSLIGDRDGTILALMNNRVVRFKEDGAFIPAWLELEEGGEPKKGFFAKLFGGNDSLPSEQGDEDWAPYVKDIGSRPKKVSADFTKLGLSPDGHIYFLDKSSSDGMLAKYTREGKQLWKKHIPLKYKDCKPAFDSQGRIYIVGMNNNSNTNLIRFSPDGQQVETLVTDLLEGGMLEEEDMLTVNPDGTVICFKFYNRMKIFNPDMSLKYISEQSKNDDMEALERAESEREK
jgi:predicted RNA-binding Zn-ribbon protein involved in translation (DUF1610 family)